MQGLCALGLTVWLLSAVTGAWGAGAAEVQRYISDRGLQSFHVGVGYDVQRGRVSHGAKRLFVPMANLSDQFEIDPFMADFDVEVYTVNSLRQFYEASASMVGLSFVPGMFCKAELPFFKPGDDGHPVQEYTTHLSQRSEEILAIRFKANVPLDPDFVRALSSLPSTHDSSNKDLWDNFFHDYPTHWTDAAYVGGRVQLSSITRFDSHSAQVSTAARDRDLRRTLERVLRDIEEWKGSGVFADESNLKAELKEDEDPVLRARNHAREHLLEHTVMHMSVIGGNASVIGSSFSNVTWRAYEYWLESVYARPAVIRYNVQPISVLVTDLTKRAVLDSAIHSYLQDAYTKWAVKPKGHHILLSAEARNVKLEETNMLRKRREQLVNGIAELEKRIDSLEECQSDVSSKKELVKRCQLEKKAFQSTLIRCENRFLVLQTMEDRLHGCELDLFTCSKLKGFRAPAAQQANASLSAPPSTVALETEKPGQEQLALVVDEKEVEPALRDTAPPEIPHEPSTTSSLSSASSSPSPEPLTTRPVEKKTEKENPESGKQRDSVTRWLGFASMGFVLVVGIVILRVVLHRGVDP